MELDGVTFEAEGPGHDARQARFVIKPCNMCLRSEEGVYHLTSERLFCSCSFSLCTKACVLEVVCSR